MIKVLTILLWPAVIASIGCAALAMTRRESALHHPVGRTGDRARDFDDAATADLAWRPGLLRFAAFLAAGALLIYGVMSLLGLLVVHDGLTIDRPIYSWTLSHRVHLWAGVMKRLTKIGDTWTTWGAAGAAATCLAVTWRRNRWVPPVALGTLVIVDHFLTLALRHTFHRVGPPDSPLGTYPSGGCDRVVVFYGLIAYLIWREHSGKRQSAVLSVAVVAALVFNEGYSRAYLTLHWLTDILSGCLYGGLLLLVFVIAVRATAGPIASSLASDCAPDDEGAIRAPAGTRAEV